MTAAAAFVTAAAEVTAPAADSPPDAAPAGGRRDDGDVGVGAALRDVGVLRDGAFAGAAFAAAAVCFAGALFLPATALDGVDFLAVVFLAAAFLAVDLDATVFLATDFLVAVAVLFAAFFVAGAFFATVVLAADLVVGAFFAVAVFLAAVFLAAVFLAAVFFAVAAFVATAFLVAVLDAVAFALAVLVAAAFFARGAVVPTAFLPTAFLAAAFFADVALVAGEDFAAVDVVAFFVAVREAAADELEPLVDPVTEDVRLVEAAVAAPTRRKARPIRPTAAMATFPCAIRVARSGVGPTPASAPVRAAQYRDRRVAPLLPTPWPLPAIGHSRAIRRDHPSTTAADTAPSTVAEGPARIGTLDHSRTALTRTSSDGLRPEATRGW